MRTYLLAAMAATVLCAAGVSGTLAQSSNDGNNRWMTVKNASKLTANNIYIIQAKEDCCWSRDLLPRAVKIKSKYSLEVNFDDGTGACSFDIRITSPEGPEWNFDHINVCRHAAITLKDEQSGQSSSDKKNRWMKVNNDSELTAVSAYIIPSTSDCCWSRDLLGAYVVSKGRSMQVNFDDGSRQCTFDIRITSGDPGKDWNFDRINVCDAPAITLK